MSVGSSRVRGGLRTVAVLEALKGAVVLLAGFGLLTLVHKDVQAVVEQFVRRTHLNPARHYPQIFIDAASRVTDARLWTLAWLAFCYAAARLVEAYGLWRERRWAEWFAAVAGGIYLPIEVYELALGVTWVKLVTFSANAGIVAYMVYALYRTTGARGPDDVRR
jgi:uncharacterized membrane protein (DUF2068 family)